MPAAKKVPSKKKSGSKKPAKKNGRQAKPTSSRKPKAARKSTQGKSTGLLDFFKKPKKNADSTVSAEATPSLPGMAKVEDLKESYYNSSLKKTVQRTVPIYKLNDRPGYFYRGCMNIDADGSPKCYHPSKDSLALDDLQNSTSNSRVYVQNVSMPGKKLGVGPADGFYVSHTSLGIHAHPERCDSFVDAEQIPYVVFPANFRDVELGACGVILNTQNGKLTHAIFADTNPRVGEASIKAARNLGLTQNNPRNGVDENIFIYLIFPGTKFAAQASAPHWPDSVIREVAMEHLEDWGGLDKLRAIAKVI